VLVGFALSKVSDVLRDLDLEVVFNMKEGGRRVHDWEEMFDVRMDGWNVEGWEAAKPD